MANPKRNVSQLDAYYAKIKAEKAKAEKAAKEKAEQDKKAKEQKPAGTTDQQKAKVLGKDPDFKETDRTKGESKPEVKPAQPSGPKTLKPTDVDPTVTQKNEDRDVAFAQQKEHQAQAHKNQLDILTQSQHFQREEADRADQRWYAHQDYDRAMKNRNFKWSFKSTSNGQHTSSRWNFENNPGAREQPGTNGRIGVPDRGPDGKSRLRMNGPAIAPSRPIGGSLRRTDLPVRSGEQDGAEGGTTREVKNPGLKSFSFTVKPTTVAQDVTAANAKLKPEDRDPHLGTKDANGISYEQKLNMIAEATASGAKVSIAHQAVDAAGKPVGSPTTIEKDGGGTVGAFTQNQGATTPGNDFQSALQAAEQIQGVAAGSFGSTSKHVQEVDNAIKQQNLAKAGVTPQFKLSDFTQRKQGRDGKYYDA